MRCGKQPLGMKRKHREKKGNRVKLLWDRFELQGGYRTSSDSVCFGPIESNTSEEVHGLLGASARPNR